MKSTGDRICNTFRATLFTVIAIKGQEELQHREENHSIAMLIENVLRKLPKRGEIQEGVALSAKKGTDETQPQG